MSDGKKLNPTAELIGQVARVTLSELKKHGIEPKEESDFYANPIKKSDLDAILLKNRDSYMSSVFSNTEHAKEINNQKGQERWFHLVSFAGTTLECVGYISREKRGFWKITEKGSLALDGHESKKENLDEQLGKDFLIFHEESRKRRQLERDEFEEGIGEDTESVEQTTFDTDNIRSAIYDYLEKKINPYQFQELVAYLFEGMGYSIFYIAERGPDGGVDIIAHKDPIGVEGKVVKIQVKHAQDRDKSGIDYEKVRAFRDLCKEGSSGVFVSLKGFTRDAENRVRTDGAFITLIDVAHFVELWIKHIDTIPEGGKKLFPLRKEYIIDFA